MFKIALVQNLSEMRNYSYADLRKDLQNMHFQVISITKDNLEALDQAIAQGVDCVLFASNSLNDSKIYEYVCREAFIEAFETYLAAGGATLVLHQNNLKEKENPLPFIDTDIKKLEKNYAGANVELKINEKHAPQYFSFPNQVTEADISDQCFQNTGLSGHYWLLLRGNEEDWKPILTDNYGNNVIASYQNRRVIFSSVLLDFQKHTKLLHNILVNLIVDNMSLAILQEKERNSLGFSYFLNSLENSKLYYKRYKCEDKDLEELRSNIRMGIHSAIMINKRCRKYLSDALLQDIDEYGVKLIQVNDHKLDQSDSFTVHSVDKSVSLQFAKAELQIRAELEEGFVSGSFMKTADVLMKLKEFEKKGMTNGRYDKADITHVLEKISAKMDVDGSYDRTFGATCKVLWVFAEFLGKDNKLTQASRKYVQGNNRNDSLREHLEKHYVLSIFEKDPQAYLKAQCFEKIQEVIKKRFSDISEYDFLAILKVALAIRNEQQLIDLFDFVKNSASDNGEIFNCYVTSNIATALIEMNQYISDKQYQDSIRKKLFEIVIYLRQVKTDTMSIDEHIQLLSALYLFEKEVSFPVNDLTELIFKTGTFPHDYHIFERQVSHYQKARQHYDQMVSDSQKAIDENKVLKPYKRAFFLVLTMLVVAIYLMVYMVIAYHEADVPIFRSVILKIAETWPSLFTILVIPLVSKIYDRFIKKRDSK